MIIKLFWGDKNELLHVEIGEVNLLHLLNVCYYILLLKDSQTFTALKIKLCKHL